MVEVLCRSTGLHVIRMFMWQQEAQIPSILWHQVCISIGCSGNEESGRTIQQAMLSAFSAHMHALRVVLLGIEDSSAQSLGYGGCSQVSYTPKS